jgi:hypothetical protein
MPLAGLERNTGIEVATNSLENCTLLRNKGQARRNRYVPATVSKKFGYIFHFRTLSGVVNLTRDQAAKSRAITS